MNQKSRLDTGMNRFWGFVGIGFLVVLTFWAFAPQSTHTGTSPGVRVGSTEAYNPVVAGERLPEGFRQLLPRDAIAPIYEPVFVAGDLIAWPDGVQVIGVHNGDDAKAYPVSFLNRREMVLDELGGDPLLVTW